MLSLDEIWESTSPSSCVYLRTVATGAIGDRLEQSGDAVTRMREGIFRCWSLFSSSL